MYKLILAVLVVAFVLVNTNVVYAEETEDFWFGLSQDGVIWTARFVEVPVDDYIVVNFQGVELYFWGSEFDEGELPPAASGVCHCSVHIRSTCPCGHYCRYSDSNGSKEGTCVH